MVDPTTNTKQLAIPTHGSDVDTWDQPVNADFSAIDGMLGGFATIALSSATTFALTTGTGSITPGSGPSQSQNALIRLTGTLTGTATLQFTLPGFYIVENKCTVGAFCVALAPSAGTGNTIGAPPGRKAHVFYDGTSMDYVDMPEVGSALDLHGVTAIPAWMSVCTVKPYLIKDGTIYTSSVYPQLASMLGSSFGGNGINTFGVPDERNRFRLGIDTGATGRVTAAVSGINGTSMGSSGGDQAMQLHNHTAIDHSHTIVGNGNGVTSGGNFTAPNMNNGVNTFQGAGTPLGTTGTTVLSISSTGGGGSQNMPPTTVSFLPLIKT